MPREAGLPICVTSLTNRTTRSFQYPRMPPCCLPGGLCCVAVAECSEQLGGGAVLGGLEVRVSSKRHVRASVPSPAGGSSPVHTLRDQVGHHEMPKVVQATAHPDRPGHTDELLRHVDGLIGRDPSGSRLKT